MSEYTKMVAVPLAVEPCVNCGGTDVKVSDCGYSSFNVGSVTCKTCGYEVKANGMSTTEDYLRYWSGEKNRLTAVREGYVERIAAIDAMHAFRGESA